MLLLTIVPVKAQNYVQSGVQGITDPKTSYTFTFKQPNTSPCTLFISARAWTLTIQDSNGNVWAKSLGHNGLWYTTTCNSGIDTITIPFSTPTYLQAVFAEYQGILVPDQASGSAQGSSALAVSSSIQATAGELVLGVGWNDNNQVQATAGLGFQMRQDTNVFLEDQTQSVTAQAVSTVSYPVIENWVQAVVAFQVSVPPPPPPQKINLPVTGGILFDDQTAFPIPVSLNAQQSDNQGGLVNAGQIQMDAQGNLSGTLIIDPTLSTSSGFVTLQFSVDGIGGTISETFLLQEFQQGSTALNLQMVLFKSVMLPKSFSAGLLP